MMVLSDGQPVRKIGVERVEIHADTFPLASYTEALCIFFCVGGCISAGSR